MPCRLICVLFFSFLFAAPSFAFADDNKSFFETSKGQYSDVFLELDKASKIMNESSILRTHIFFKHIELLLDVDRFSSLNSSSDDLSKSKDRLYLNSLIDCYVMVAVLSLPERYHSCFIYNLASVRMLLVSDFSAAVLSLSNVVLHLSTVTFLEGLHPVDGVLDPHKFVLLISEYGFSVSRSDGVVYENQVDRIYDWFTSYSQSIPK